MAQNVMGSKEKIDDYYLNVITELYNVLLECKKIQSELNLKLTHLNKYMEHLDDDFFEYKYKNQENINQMNAKINSMEKNFVNELNKKNGKVEEIIAQKIIDYQFNIANGVLDEIMGISLSNHSDKSTYISNHTNMESQKSTKSDNLDDSPLKTKAKDAVKCNRENKQDLNEKSLEAAIIEAQRLKDKLGLSSDKKPIALIVNPNAFLSQIIDSLESLNFSESISDITFMQSEEILESCIKLLKKLNKHELLYR
jgi:hypothetical protein